MLLNQATATREPSAEMDGPFTGQPLICQLSAKTGCGVVQAPFTCRTRLCTKTTHVSEWMIISNLPQRLPRTFESHQRELVDRSFKPEGAAIEESTN